MKKKICLILLILLLSLTLFSCDFVNEYETGIDVANEVLPCVIEITCNFQASVSYATGFIIDEAGYVMTNAHVVTDSIDRFVYEATEIIGKFYNSNEEYLLNIIDFNIEKDLAILQFQRNDLILKKVSTAPSKNLSYGATIYTIGNAEGYGLSMTKGIISVPKRMFKDSETDAVNEVIQIDAAVNNGSSGGPLINIKGKVIGIISFKIKNNTSSDIEGIGFVIPSSIFIPYFDEVYRTIVGESEELSSENDEPSAETDEEEA